MPKWRQAMMSVKQQDNTYIHPLFQLTILNLPCNKLQSFDETGLVSLQLLNSSNNQLQSFDGTGLVSLKELNLYNNQLRSFDGAGLVKLKTLYLRVGAASYKALTKAYYQA